MDELNDDIDGGFCEVQLDKITNEIYETNNVVNMLKFQRNSNWKWG